MTVDPGPVHARNIGGDCEWKRLLFVDAESGEEQAPSVRKE